MFIKAQASDSSASGDHLGYEAGGGARLGNDEDVVDVRQDVVV